MITNKNIQTKDSMMGANFLLFTKVKNWDSKTREQYLESVANIILLEDVSLKMRKQLPKSFMTKKYQ